MELEVAGLSVAAAEVARVRVAALQRQIDDLALKPLQRLETSATEALAEAGQLLGAGGTGQHLSEALRSRSAETGKVAQEAERLLGRLVASLDETGPDGVQEGLHPAIERLSDRVTVPAGALV